MIIRMINKEFPKVDQSLFPAYAEQEATISRLKQRMWTLGIETHDSFPHRLEKPRWMYYTKKSPKI